MLNNYDYIYITMIYNNILIEVADDISGDALTELSALLRHKYYSRDAFVDYDSDCPLPNCSLVYSGSIHTFYIKPEFRQKNIGGFLLKNLNKILAYYEDINVRCLITYVNPYHNDKPEKYASTNDEGPSEQDKKMIKHICSFLRKNGFKKVRGKDNIYIVDLFEEAIC